MMRLILAAGLLLLPAASHAHDIYGGVTVKGLPCCGGTGPNADCEPLEADQIKVGPEIRIYSKRWNAWIRVSQDRVQWMVLPQDPLARPGHYCGVPRRILKYYSDATPDDPDPEFRSYCIFITPGGS